MIFSFFVIGSTRKLFCRSRSPTDFHCIAGQCFPGDTVDEEMVEYFVNSVPPVLLRASCTQAGEPHSHEQDERGSHRPTYITFHDLGGGCWQFDGYCFEGENTNRIEKTYRQQRFEKRLAEARREAEQHG